MCTPTTDLLWNFIYICTLHVNVISMTTAAFPSSNTTLKTSFPEYSPGTILSKVTTITINGKNSSFSGNCHYNHGNFNHCTCLPFFQSCTSLHCLKENSLTCGSITKPLLIISNLHCRKPCILYLNIVEFYHLNYLAFYPVKPISKADFQLLWKN